MADIEMCDTADWGCKVSTAHVPEHAACSLSCISAHVGYALISAECSE